MTAVRYAIVGGAGFIGAHAVDRLLSRPEVEAVTVYDNFTSGRAWHLAAHVEDPRLRVVHDDVKHLEPLVEALSGTETVVHLASNPDIAAAAADPTIDFWEGTFLTNQVMEAARQAGVSTILYASGSGVYGDVGVVASTEDQGSLEPVSTYGASKLAGEALLASYAHMFGMRCRAFRFGNVVGPHQTHGVGFDFVRRLLAEPTRLVILGDGRQSKSYIHVADVLDAVFLAESLAAADEADPFQAFNVATGDYITVTEIAALAMQVVGLDPAEVLVEYTGGDRGWRGDVPVVRLDTARIRSLGWDNARNSAQALTAAMESMLADFTSGRM
ncbi:MAG: NAD-dependent epimerase/dehydratase family protein [Actinomycetota bacterium]|nr:NAD-dependent epimerase/dehydratase family protein [Actinomycetota bacterium]